MGVRGCKWEFGWGSVRGVLVEGEFLRVDKKFVAILIFDESARK